MKTYAIHTLGCKVNQYESQQIRQTLEQFGLAGSSRTHPADVVVVNTCCVTHVASAKSRQAIRRAHKARPDAAIVVTGCLTSGDGAELQHLSDIHIVKDKTTLPGVLNHLFGNSTPVQHTDTRSKPANIPKIKDKNSSLSQNNAPDGTQISLDTENRRRSMAPLHRFDGQCRAFLKIQDGCDASCTYCIIPKIRTNVCSKDIKTVLDEAKSLIAAGHKEIILTGIFLGAYGQTTARRKKWDANQRDTLANLVDAVASLDGLERLRLSSLEPLDVTDTLLAVMTAHANIAPHLHLSLQSGSADVLRKMARQYSIDDFMRVVERVKDAFDRPAITTDIIVGFPGETDADFQDTLRIAEQAGFAKIHVFPFSPRKNTAAVKMAKLFGKIDAKELKRRSSALLELDKQLQQKFRRACKGLTENVLIEKNRPTRGRCRRYFMVDVSGNPDAKGLKIGDTLNVVIE
ncbi:MAG: tRNA (N(6)-L-threonylcarbamoyladenosine(37)-C(2))-methylthiotransferase MtaB [Planctomycetes bacterium]|nr:tRNA (N(6)-L-threonylcarbamoyladenosine(37)-C(2))-methylthiotransferase MtaB [Planctomycetota bacterium]